MNGRLRPLLAALAAVVLAAACGTADGEEGRSGPTPDTLLVAAASDLRPAFEELAELHRRQTGTAVTLSFGSSGQLARQIVHGAPFDVFASADVGYVEEVVAAGRGDPATVADYAIGRIVVWAAPGAGRGAVPVGDLDDPGIGRIAIANPAHAPYGRAALEALRAAGVHARVADRLVHAQSVSAAQQLVQSGAVDVGIIAVSLARAVPGGTAVEVPSDLHSPLRQALVVTAPPARRTAAAGFVDLVGGEQGREVMRRHGFALPGAAAPGG